MESRVICFPGFSRSLRTHLRTAVLAAAVAAAPSLASAQNASAASPAPSKLKLETGREIYEAGCVNCHGPDGKGAPKSQIGFDMPPTAPDFSDCPTATAEPDVQWRAIVTHGGPARAFSRIMPAFKDQLTAGQIDRVVDYLRGFLPGASLAAREPEPAASARHGEGVPRE